MRKAIFPLILILALPCSAAFAGGSLQVGGALNPSLSLKAELFFMAGNQIPLLCGDNDIGHDGNFHFQPKENDQVADIQVDNGRYNFQLSLDPPFGVCGWQATNSGEFEVGDATNANGLPSTIFFSVSTSGAQSVTIHCSSSNGFTDCDQTDNLNIAPNAQINFESK